MSNLSLDLLLSQMRVSPSTVDWPSEEPDSGAVFDFQSQLDLHSPFQHVQDGCCDDLITVRSLTINNETPSITESEISDDSMNFDLLFISVYYNYPSQQKVNLEVCPVIHHTCQEFDLAISARNDNNCIDETLCDTVAISLLATDLTRSVAQTSTLPRSDSYLFKDESIQDNHVIFINPDLIITPAASETNTIDSIAFSPEITDPHSKHLFTDVQYTLEQKNSAIPDSHAHEPLLRNNNGAFHIHHETQAELQLTPETLGRVNISMGIGKDGAAIALDAERKVSQEYIDQQLPQLVREIEKSGVTLASITSGHGESGRRHRQQEYQKKHLDSTVEINSATGIAKARHYNIIDQLA